MENKNDLVDVLDEDIQEDDFTQEQLDSAETDWMKIAKEQKGKLKRQATKFRKIKEQKDYSSQSSSKKDDDTLGELDRTDRMFLRSQGITGEEEIALAKIWKQRYKIDVDQMLDDDVFQAKLKTIRDKKAVNDALPDGKGRSNSNATESVEYYLERNEFPPADKFDLRTEYINRKKAAIKGNKGPFYNSQ